MTVPTRHDGGAPSVLLVVHGLPPDEHTGTPLAARGYATELGRRGWDVTVLHPSDGAQGWDRLHRRRWPGEDFWRLAVPPTAARGALWALQAPPFPADPTPPTGGPDAAVCAVLDELHPDVVHVIDNVDLPLSIPELAAARGIPVVRTVSCAEDLCGLIAPVSPRSGPGGYCTAPLTAGHCAGCIASTLDPVWASWQHPPARTPATGSSAAGSPTIDSPTIDSPTAGGLTPSSPTAGSPTTGSPTAGSPTAPNASSAAAEAVRRRHDRLVGLLLRKRARAVRHFGDVYDRIVFASANFRQYFEQTLPLDPDRVCVVPMGVDLPPIEPGGTGSHRDDTAATATGPAHAGSGTSTSDAYAGKGTSSSDGRPAEVAAPPSGADGTPRPAGPPPVRLVLLALADPAKGIRAVVDAFTHPDLADRGDWRLVLAGGGDRSRFGPLLDDPRVTDHGPYGPGDLARLLGGADVGLSTSVFETYHRVTREYLAAGLAVVGSTAFGITDIVVPGTNGLAFDHAEPESLVRAVTALADDRLLLSRLQSGARATAIRSVAEEVDDLEALYRGLVPARRPTAALAPR